MTVIKRKVDAFQLLEEFTNFASYDYENNKHYFVFDDKDRDGHYTLMKKNDQWSIHGKGEDYCDIGETTLHDFDNLIDFIWKHRRNINKSLKGLPKEEKEACFSLV